MNIYLILQMASEAMGEREAVVCGDHRLSFEDLAIAARAIAAKLRAGEKLAYLAENAPAMPAALFGAALKGTPFVPINYRLAETQISTLLARVTPAKLITEQTIKLEGLTSISPHEALCGNPYDREAPDEEQGVAIELFTSGTTGEPKSAILKHDNLMSYILGTAEFMSASEDEATLICVPPYHIAGISAVLSSTYVGRKMVQLPNFSPGEWLRLVREENVTHAFVVPTMLQRIMESGEDLDLPSLRFLAYGGGKMPMSVIEQAMKRWPQVSFTNAYGLTETSSTICLLGPDEHRTAVRSDDASIRRRLTSVGRPLPTIEVEIRHENGEICKAEHAGLVFVRGDQVSGEYKGLGSQLDAQGWFPTKDRGYLDGDGFLYLDGRDDDVIVRGGENISPGEIEELLRSHKAIRDVAAVAVSDTEWGEVVGLAVVCDDEVSNEEICALVRQNLRSSRVPAVIRRWDELPYNETGKLLRRVIRDKFAN